MDSKRSAARQNLIRQDGPLPSIGTSVLRLTSDASGGDLAVDGEDFAPDHDLFKAYRVLDTMLPDIARAQQDGRIHGFKLAARERQTFAFGRYEVSISGPGSSPWMFGVGAAAPATSTGYGLVIQTGEDEFLIVGHAVDVKFAADGRPAEMDSAGEGVFENGRWIPGRTLNGDERYFLFPTDALQTVRVRLLRHT